MRFNLYCQMIVSKPEYSLTIVRIACVLTFITNIVNHSSTQINRHTIAIFFCSIDN